MYALPSVAGSILKLVVVLPFLATNVPLFSLLRVLGIETIDEAVACVDCRDAAAERAVRLCFEDDPNRSMPVEELHEVVNFSGTVFYEEDFHGYR